MRSELSSAILTLRAPAVAFIPTESSAVACASSRRQSVIRGETGLGITSSNFFTGFAKFGGMAKVI